MADTQVDANTVQWLTSAYSLAETIVIPLSAYLIGRFSTKKLFIFGISLFAIGSLLTGIAPVFGILLVGRMLQAAATGIAMPMVFTVILLIFPREKRGSAMDIISLAIGFAPAVGPSISGLLVDSVGWRALFIMVCILAIIVILLAFFFRRQVKLEVPLLKVSILKTCNYAITVSIAAGLQAALVGTGVLLPIYLQNLLGISALETGMIMLPGAVIGAIVGSFAGRWFDRLGPRKVIIPCAFIFLLGGCGLIAFSLDTPIPFIIAVYTCLSVGMTGTITPINIWGINSLDNKAIQQANALSNTMNQVGASLGSAILVSLSATSTFLFPNLPPLEQTMMDDKIVFCFTVTLMIIIFVVIAVAVRDNRKSAFNAADAANAMRLPTKANDHISVDLAMNQEPYFVHDTDTIREVVQILAANKTSGVPVVDKNKKIVGFISNGDIMKYIGRSDGTLLDASRMLYQIPDTDNFMQRVADLIDLNVMLIATKGAISVPSGSSLDDACRLLAEKRIKKVPVIDAGGALIGSLSRSDIIRSTMANLTSIETLLAADQTKKATA